MLPDEQMNPAQIQILCATPVVRRSRCTEQLYGPARDLKSAGVRAQHPDWLEYRVNGELHRLFLHART